MVVTEIARESRKIRACAYVRVSTREDQQEDSFENQKQYWETKLKCDPRIDFIGIFSDEGISGRKVEERTGYMNMMRLVKAGEIDRIYVKSVSRFGRNKIEALKAIQEVRDMNAEIYFEKENVYTSDPKCSISLTSMATFAEMELDSLSKNIKWSYQKKLERGEVIFSKCYGYSLVNKKRVINEEEARWVRFIFESYVYEKKPSYEIANELNKSGVKSSKGACFSNVLVKRILTNPTYIGDTVRLQTIKKNGKRVENKGEVKKYYFENTHPAIIDRELFSKAQSLSYDPKPSRRGLFQKEGGPLSRKLKCKSCDSFYVHSGDGLWFCPGYEQDCDLTVLQEGAVVAMVRKCLELYNASFKDIDGMKKIEDELKRLEAKSELLKKDFNLGKIDPEEFDRISEEVTRDIKAKQKGKKSLKVKQGVEYELDKMTNEDVIGQLKIGMVNRMKMITITLKNGFTATVRYPKLDRRTYTWQL